MIEVEKHEKIIRVVRKHWFVLLSDIFVLVFAVTLPVIFLIGFHFLPIESIISVKEGGMFALGGFFLFAWLVLVWMFGWNLWTDYFLDVLIITDKRIFDINQQGLFSRKSGSFRIDRIQNVSIDQSGIIQTLLDFGTIRLETAGESEEFIAPYVSRPYNVKKLINQMQDTMLDKTEEVQLHPDTIERIQPGDRIGNVGAWPYTKTRDKKNIDPEDL